MESIKVAFLKLHISWICLSLRKDFTKSSENLLIGVVLILIVENFLIAFFWATFLKTLSRSVFSIKKHLAYMHLKRGCATIYLWVDNKTRSNPNSKNKFYKDSSSNN